MQEGQWISDHLLNAVLRLFVVSCRDLCKDMFIIIKLHVVLFNTIAKTILLLLSIRFFAKNIITLILRRFVPNVLASWQNLTDLRGVESQFLKLAHLTACDYQHENQITVAIPAVDFKGRQLFDSQYLGNKKERPRALANSKPTFCLITNCIHCDIMTFQCDMSAHYCGQSLEWTI